MFEFDTGKTYQKTTDSRVLIRFQDCDPLKHLNNAKYFDYFFNAREDQVPQLYGIEPSSIFKTFNAVWVVYNHQIAYVRPALMGEWVKIHSRIIWFNHNSVIVEYFMTDDKSSHLKTVLWSHLRFVGNDGASTDHPQKLQEYLQAVTDQVDIDTVDFQRRIKHIKSSLPISL